MTLNIYTEILGSITHAGRDQLKSLGYITSFTFKSHGLHNIDLRECSSIHVVTVNLAMTASQFHYVQCMQTDYIVVSEHAFTNGYF